MLFSIIYVIVGLVCIAFAFAKEEDIGLIGYRSSASCENKKNWRIANIEAGIIAILGGILMFFIWIQNDLSVGFLFVIFIVIFIGMVIIVELTLLIYEKMNKKNN